MVLLLNMFKATAPASETLSVDRLFNHLFCSNTRLTGAPVFYPRILVEPEGRGGVRSCIHTFHLRSTRFIARLIVA